ncbi:MAG: hypothetical protein EBX35_01740 [Planctomycetia bacterium]|jgi:hypothetical protein|nr:hypothetical protein [Planctomycetia bacterium]
MKVRICVLVVCMTVVPALAMFSHHVPVGVRQAVRHHLWQPVVDWLQPAKASGGPEAVAEVADAHAEDDPGTAPPPTPVAPGRPPAVDRLAALGAVAIDVRPLDGVAGMHVASCRVAMDAAGQLHRVFQAPGSDPGAATAALADQVEAWRDRLASRVTIPGPAAGSL